MRKLIKSLSPWTEFWIVILAAQGWFVYASLSILFSGEHWIRQSGAGLWLLACHQAVALLLLGWFLRLRGWTLPLLGFIPGWRDTAIGICLAGAFYLAFLALNHLFVAFVPDTLREEMTIHIVRHNITPLSLFANVLTNPLYEELFVGGYLVKFLKEQRGPILAVTFGIMLRVLYHLYQGPICILQIVPLGLLFGLWYVKTGRLWPLVVAHAALDFFPLAHYLSF